MNATKEKQSIPSLTEIRAYIRKNGWNGRWWVKSASQNREFFYGECHSTSEVLSAMLTGRECDYSMVRRGWYGGEITSTGPDDPCATFDRSGKKHIHSWVVLKDGTIVDPTWWQFTDAPAKIYVFPAKDARYEIVPEEWHYNMQ